MDQNPGIWAIQKLAHLGYGFKVSRNTIRASYEGQKDPDPAIVRPLLALVKEHKGEVIDYLARKPQSPERILTCFSCGYFSPAVSSSNPAQAWGCCVGHIC